MAGTISPKYQIGYNYIPSKTAMASPGTKLWDMTLELIRNPEDMRTRDEVFIVSEIDLYEGSTVFLGTNFNTPYFGCKAKSTQQEMYDYMIKHFKM